ncbi:MAG TPA: ABC transporter substrate-binding protein [Abditibacteriaceae bacterium]|jgi:branched-chain amino acid transport system substrate-binding protein
MPSFLLDKRASRALLCAALAFVLSGCKEPPASTSDSNASPTGTESGTQTDASTVGKAKPYDRKDVILIGEYGDLTGDTAAFGTSTRDGIALAVDEANKAGGLLGKKIQIQLEDNNGKPDETTSRVKKLINQDNVLAVLGEVASSRSKMGAQVCQAAGVPMITPTSTNPNVTQVGDYIFRTCFIDPFQGTICARFAAQNLKAKRVAILTDTANAYSVGLTDFFKKEFVKNGGQIVAEENYKAKDQQFGSQLNNIKTANPEAIFLPGYYQDVATIAKQARDAGLDQPMFGGDGWDDPDLVALGGDAVQNCYFTTHASEDSGDPRMKQFSAKFRAFHKGKSPGALAAVAYDAANILFAAIKKAGGTDRAKIRDAIAATTKFPGVTGDITINKDRNVVKQLVILQVKDDKFKYVATIKP